MRKICSCCGQRMPRKYSHSLNRPLCEALVELYVSPDHTGVISKLNINHSQINNFHKLRYWGLVERAKFGLHEWKVTELGELFIRGETHLPSCVYTVNNERVATGGKSKNIDDILNPRWRNREDYAKTFYDPDYGLPRLFKL